MKNNDRSWMFKHLNKIVGMAFIIIFFVIIVQVAVGVYAINEVSDHGLESVVERIWNGNDEQTND